MRCKVLLVAASAVVASFTAVSTTDPPAVAAGLTRPNIVLVVTDDQTFESFPAAMPFLAAEPGGSWVRFTNAVVNVSNCCPSRATILSGRYSHHTDVRTNEDGWKFDAANSIATWLRSGGYRTSLIGKYLNDYPWDRGAGYVPPGWDDWVGYSPNAVNDGSGDYVLVENGTPVRYDVTVEGNYSTDVFRRKAVNFVKTASEPFFLYLTTRQPHYPANPAARHLDAFAGLNPWRPPNFNEQDVSDKPAWVRNLPRLTAAQRAEIDVQRQNAYRALLAVDEMVKAVFRQVKLRGLLDNTVIIFMSDNNVAMGEHRFALRKTCPYEECIHVPLAVRYPGTTQRTVDQVVSNVDIAPTIADLAGVAPTIAQDGRTLRPLLEGTAVNWPDEALLSKGPSTTPDAPDYGPGDDDGGDAPKIGSYWGIRTRQWKYVEYRSGERELYDLAADPWELTNRAGAASHAVVEAELAERLARLQSY